MLSETHARQNGSDSAFGRDLSSEKDKDDVETWMLSGTDSFETDDYDVGFVHT